jgi:uncharacterized protein (DUF427 family)
MTQTIKTPGPDHPITVTRAPERVRVLFHGHLLGESSQALTLREADYKAVRYFPRQDIETAFLRRTAKTSYCPYKGEATYFTLYRDGQLMENAVWSYEHPHPAMAQIAGYLAFYPDTVDYEVEPLAAGEVAGESPAIVDEVIRHTDAGDGTSQETPWKPNAPRQPYSGTGAI